MECKSVFGLKCILIALLLVPLNMRYADAQKTDATHFLQPADSFSTQRFRLMSGITAVSYAGCFTGLGIIWYSKFPKSSFHFFNDAGEWRNMDKYGHTYSGHVTSALLYKGAKWAGMPERNAIWSASAVAFTGLLTLEVLDGFSAKWGFSPSDLAFNTLGVGLFASQQFLWRDQRILPKWSSYPTAYPDVTVYSDQGIPSNIQIRAADLFGTTLAEKVAKDYNASIFWLSANVKAFFPESNIPSWINIAAGIGAQNMFGGYSNQWMKDGEHFVLPKDVLPRYNQYYLGLDIDTARIQVKSPFLKTFFSIFRHIKIPLPAVEFTSRGKVIFHPILF